MVEVRAKRASKPPGRVVVVTGTSTGVGKTVATATLAARAVADGEHVVAVKPVQSGTADGDSDVAEIQRLAGVDTVEFTALDEPLAPDTAARRADVAIPRVRDYVAPIRELTDRYDVVLVEGSGGLLVRLDTDGGTLLDLAAELADTAPTEVVVVCSAGLGTLNHTELTVNALRSRAVPISGLIVGSWPADPGLAERCNLNDLPRVTELPLLDVIPEGAGG